jgi:hypothetical protein
MRGSEMVVVHASCDSTLPPQNSLRGSDARSYFKSHIFEVVLSEGHPPTRRLVPLSAVHRRFMACTFCNRGLRKVSKWLRLVAHGAAAVGGRCFDEYDECFCGALRVAVAVGCCCIDVVRGVSVRGANGCAGRCADGPERSHVRFTDGRNTGAADFAHPGDHSELPRREYDRAPLCADGA